MPARFQTQILLFESIDPSRPSGLAPEDLLSCAAAMVTDLLSAKDVPSSPLGADGIVAETVDAEETIHLIRQIQMLFEGFSKSVAGVVQAGMKVLLAGAEQEGSAAETGRSSGRAASPGLVLFSPEAYAEAATIPGLRFKRVSAQAGMGPCWELLPPEWLAESRRVEHAGRDAERASVAPGKSGAVNDPSGRIKVKSGALRSSGPLAGKSLPGWVIPSGVGVAAVLVGAGWLGLHGRDKPHPVPAAISAPVVTNPVGASAGGQKIVSPAPTSRGGPAPNVAAVAVARTPTKNPVIVPPQPPEKEPSEHIAGGLSEEEIRLLLVKADKASGNGEYDKAITYYNYILRRDPRNAAAQRGLARAKQNRGG